MGGLTGEENHQNKVKPTVVLVRREGIGEARVARIEGERTEWERQRSTSEQKSNSDERPIGPQSWL